MNKINFKIKIQNPAFWYMALIGLFSIIGAYFGISATDMTSWKAVTDTLGAAIANPYVVWTLLVYIIGLFVSFDTTGLKDSVITNAKNSLADSTVEIVKEQMLKEDEEVATANDNTVIPAKTEETTSSEVIAESQVK